MGICRYLATYTAPTDIDVTGPLNFLNPLLRSVVMSHDDDNERYDVSREEFDDVTELLLPESSSTDSQLRLHDAEANTLLYVTESRDNISVNVRDDSAFTDE